jgi:hypothetical protein
LTVNTVNICFVGTSKLAITADDEVVELFVDGVKTNFLPGGWKSVRLIDIPANTRVIAVKAKDTAKVSRPGVRL